MRSGASTPAQSISRAALSCLVRFRPGCARRPCASIRARAAAFTLVELILVVAIVAILTTIAVASYSSYIDRANVARAKGDIVQIELTIARFVGERQVFPDSLSDLGGGPSIDPWGNPYQYLNLDNIKGNGKARKDKSLVPINSDYDLYSMGKDGQSVPPLTAKQSQDDVVRGRNGAFVGLASDF